MGWNPREDFFRRESLQKCGLMKVHLSALTTVAALDAGKVDGADRLKVGLPQSYETIIPASGKTVPGLVEAKDGTLVCSNGAEELALAPCEDIASDRGGVRHTVGAKGHRELHQKRRWGGAALLSCWRVVGGVARPGLREGCLLFSGGRTSVGTGTSLAGMGWSVFPASIQNLICFTPQLTTVRSPRGLMRASKTCSPLWDYSL